MKKFICLLAAIAIAASAQAQLKLDSARLKYILSRLYLYEKITNDIYTDSTSSDYPQLVSRYTFRALTQKDYSKITIGENSFSKIGRFATVNINSDESKFYFTPITFVQSKDPTKGPFRFIHSVDFSGEVDDQNIFDFKNKKSIRGSYSLTWVLNSYKFNPKRDVAVHAQIVKSVRTDLTDLYQKAATDAAGYLAVSDDLEDTTKLAIRDKVKKRFFDNLDQVEEKYYNDKWGTKRMTWMKLNFAPLGWDNFSYIDPAQPTTKSSPADKSVYTGSLKVSVNQLLTFPSGKSQFYWAVYAAITRKHSLSEISKPVQWYNMQRLTDSTVTVADDKKVFTLNDATFKTAYRPDAGAQVIYLLTPYKDMSIGLDVATSFAGLVADRSGAYVNRTSFGLLFPFLDKNGDATINVEVFYQRKSYIHTTLANEGIWGIKFGLPFNSL
ncbi:hypothetical protein SAMN05428975_1362 [Mucilaginibacter sp. OK268]|uniref:hypothetical protein n=1 Tax=Mucilaginibacter sp. OK268 TaxID=1881048 RepID=UPI0008807883|nr:hypothetical protein [Mucilaginibacter sp. OK268]SDP47395.1 hypothetical protein SAMN05428975_1362 [Mucilaginibacter sp. OK268]